MYFELARQHKLLRRTYMELLLLLTVLVLFAATWFALYLSKLVTRPVAALAEAMEERLRRANSSTAWRWWRRTRLGQLVSSFNRMARELEASRRQLEASSRELARPTWRWNSDAGTWRPSWRAFPPACSRSTPNAAWSHTNDAFCRMLWPRQWTSLADSRVRIA